MTGGLTSTSWLLDPGIAYLNHGGYGALPGPVADAAAGWRADMEANPTDLFARRWPVLVDDVRVRVSGFLRADPAGLVFVPNATTGTATVLASLPWSAGDEIVTTDHRYGAVRSQLGVLRGRGVRIIETPIALDVDSAGAVVDAVMACVTPQTKLVVLDHIASPTGFVFPVTEVVHAAHSRGVPVLVDGAHAPGQVDVDLGQIGADFWVGNLHKWVCSPRACAALSVAPAWRDRIRPTVASHGYFDGYHAAFDWTGTADAVPLLSIPAALDFWDELGWDEVRRLRHDLATDGATLVAARLGTRVPVADEFTAAMRLIELPMSLKRDVADAITERMLLEHKVMTTITEHQGASYVRVCAQTYNGREHYERLADALVGVLP